MQRRRIEHPAYCFTATVSTRPGDIAWSIDADGRSGRYAAPHPRVS